MVVVMLIKYLKWLQLVRWIRITQATEYHQVGISYRKSKCFHWQVWILDKIKSNNYYLLKYLHSNILFRAYRSWDYQLVQIQHLVGWRIQRMKMIMIRILGILWISRELQVRMEITSLKRQRRKLLAGLVKQKWKNKIMEKGKEKGKLELIEMIYKIAPIN